MLKEPIWPKVGGNQNRCIWRGDTPSIAVRPVGGRVTKLAAARFSSGTPPPPPRRPPKPPPPPRRPPKPPPPPSWPPKPPPPPSWPPKPGADRVPVAETCSKL